MKLTTDRPYADPEAACRKVMELAHGFEPVQDGRIYIEKINGPFLFEAKGSPAEYKAGLDLAISRGLLELHESGTFVRLTQTGKDLTQGTNRPDPACVASLWRGVLVMRTPWTPSIVPRADDQDVYLVVDDLGRLGRVWREADFEDTHLETVITDLLDGQYKNPSGIFCFNPAEGWPRDVSEDVAAELRRRCDLEGREVPAGLSEFIERHEGPVRQLTLRLA